MTHKEALQRIDAILTAENTTWQDKKNNLADLICNLECRLSEDGELLAYNCEKRAKQEFVDKTRMVIYNALEIGDIECKDIEKLINAIEVQRITTTNTTA